MSLYVFSESSIFSEVFVGARDYFLPVRASQYAFLILKCGICIYTCVSLYIRPKISVI